MSDLLRVSTPSIIQPICYEYYPTIADKPTTPITSRFRLWLLINVIRIVGCLWILVWIEDLHGSFTVVDWHLRLNEPKSLKTLARNNGTRPRWAIFHVAPGGSVSTSEDLPAGLLHVSTPSKIQPIFYECYPAIADTPTTPVTSRFRLWLLFNVIRVVGCLWLLVCIEDLHVSFSVIGWHLWLKEPKNILELSFDGFGLHGRDVLLCEVTASGATSSAADAFRRRAWRQPSTIFLRAYKNWVFRPHPLTPHLPFAPLCPQCSLAHKTVLPTRKLKELYKREKNWNSQT